MNFTGIREQVYSTFAAFTGAVPEELTPSEKTTNAMMTGIAAVVLGYAATKVVSAITSIAFTVIFAVAAYKLCTDDKYKGKDILANVKALSFDTYELMKSVVMRAMAAGSPAQ